MNDDTAATYDAEDRVARWSESGQPVVVFGSTWDVEPTVRFASVASVQDYVDRILKHLEADDELGVRASVPVRVRARRGPTKAHYEPNGVIAVPDVRWAMTEAVVLHEVAHHLSPGGAHDAAFRATYVRLLRLANRPVAAELTRLCYFEAGLT